MTSDTLKILKILKKHPEGLNSRILKKKANLISRRFQDALQELLENQHISEQTKGLFRKQTVYVLTSSGKSFLETAVDFHRPAQAVFDRLPHVLNVPPPEPVQSIIPETMMPIADDEQTDLPVQSMIEPAESVFVDDSTDYLVEDSVPDPVILGERVNDITYLESYLEEFTPWGQDYFQARGMRGKTQVEQRIHLLKKAFRAIQKGELGDELAQTIQAHNALPDVPQIDPNVLMAHSATRVCKLIGDSYHQVNQFTAAIEQYNKSLEYLKTILQKKPTKRLKTQQANLLGALAACLEKNEQFNESLKVYDESIALFKELGHRERQMRMLLGKGIVLFALKDWDKAVEIYLETIQLTGERTEQLVLLQRASEIPTAAQNQKFLELLDQQKSQGEPEYVKAQFLRAEGKIRHREAIEAKGSIFEKALWDFNIGVAEVSVGRYKEAERYYQKGLKEFREISNPRGEGLCLYHLGMLYQGTQQWEKAEKHLKDAVSALLDLKSKVKIEDYRTSLQADIVPVLTNLATTYLLQGKIEDAINALEQGKSRELVRQLEGIKSAHCPQMEQLLEAEAEIAARFQATEYEMENLLKEFTDGEMEEEEYKERIKVLRENLTKDKASLQRARRTIYEKCVDPGLIPPAQDWKIVDKYLEVFQGNQALVIEFLLDPKQERLITFYCSGTEGKFKALTKSLRDTDWRTLLEKTREAIEFYDPKKLNDLAPQLYQLLFDEPEIQKAMKTVTDLIIIPHSDLYIIPWEILQPANEVPLGISHAITRNFSLDLATRLMRDQEAIKGDINLIGDPTMDLAGAFQEVSNIQKVLQPKPTRLLLREKAQKDFVKEAMQNAGIIHYAGHADFMATDPSLSLLLLNDHPLTASEIANMRFNSNPLTFLSACESGVSKGIKGGEVVGLIRSLTLAGAQTIISTNWRVSDDSACDLATAFYNALLGGSHASKALQEARKEIYNNDKYKQRLEHWAAYTIYGNPFFTYSS
ncbi:MAG: CHAT domain-containing protein [Promethearchaeota archaeon]